MVGLANCGRAAEQPWSICFFAPLNTVGDFVTRGKHRCATCIVTVSIDF